MLTIRVFGKHSLIWNFVNLVEILYGNLQKRDTLSMSSYICCPSVKEILEIWCDLFFYEKIKSEEVFSKLPLWHNSLIRIGKKPVSYKDWYLKGITKVKHLYGNSADLLSWSDFKNKYNLKVQPLTYFGIVSAINRLVKVRICQNMIVH